MITRDRCCRRNDESLPPVSSQIERQALAKESDKGSRERLADLRRELADLKERQSAMRAQWEQERAEIATVRGLREEIEQTRLAIEQAERAADLSRAAELKYGVLAGLEARLATAEAKTRDGDTPRLLRESVGEAEVDESSRWTDPGCRLVEAEQGPAPRDEILHRRVIGGDEAVRLVTGGDPRPLRHQDPRRPIGSFLFLGPTGVGKTELAKAIAEALFDSEEALVRIDMSEYMERPPSPSSSAPRRATSATREGGQLTEAVRRKPYSVLSSTRSRRRTTTSSTSCSSCSTTAV